MNLFQLQERLKDFSQDQLVNEMRNPSGSAPQYLVLSELQRRRRLMQEEQAQMPQQQATVAEEAVAAAGMPQGGLAQMAQALAPQTDTVMNTARMAEGGMIDRRIESMIADRYDEDVARRERRADELYEGARGEDREYGSGFLGRLLENLAERDDRANRRAADMLADPQGRNEIDREMADFMRSHSQTVGGFAEGGVVRMQPGGLAGISRDLRTFMNPNDRTTALLRNPFVMQQAEVMGMTPEEYAASLSRSRADALVAADLANQADLAAIPRPANIDETVDDRAARGAGRTSGIGVFTGEDQMFTADSPLAPRPSGPTEFAPMEGTDPANLGTVLGDLFTGYDPEAVAQEMLDEGRIDQEQFNRFVFGSGSERERVARETLGLEEPRVAPEPSGVETPDVTPDVDGGMRPEDRGFGRDMETAAPETGLTFGPELTAPEDDAIRTALSFGDLEAQREGASAPATTGGAAAPELSSSDDLFEQDKWLALAQFGLGLMSSQAPTLGQAIGEAGATGIAALRQAREDQQARATAAQTRADRLAAAAARAADDSEAYPYRQVDDFIELAKLFQDRAKAIVDANYGEAPTPDSPLYDEYIDALARSNAAISESARLAESQ